MGSVRDHYGASLVRVVVLGDTPPQRLEHITDEGNVLGCMEHVDDDGVVEWYEVRFNWLHLIMGLIWPIREWVVVLCDVYCARLGLWGMILD